MQLYTVEFETVHLVTVYDNRGRKTAERQDSIRQVFHDLPHSTAQAYVEAAGNGRVTAQRVEASPSRTEFRRGTPKSTAVREARKTTPAQKTAPQTNIQNAAATGNMTAAVNQVK